MTSSLAARGPRWRTPAWWAVAESATVAEILRFHVVLAFFVLVIGYVTHGAVSGALTPTMPTAPGGAVTSTSAETWYILGNNALFFLLVSLLPVVNIAFFVPQFFNVGGYIQLMSDLPFAAQFDMLYRHTALEVVALFVAMAISYSYLFALRDFTRAALPDKALLVRRLRTAALGYPIIMLFTVVGALLEGAAVVQF